MNNESTKKAAIALLEQISDIDMDKVHAVQIAIIMDKHSKPSVASSDEDKEDDPTKDPSKKEEGSDGLPRESCKECGSDDCECNKTFKPHKMYSEDGKEHDADTEEDHKRMKAMGYTHKENK